MEISFYDFSFWYIKPFDFLEVLFMKYHFKNKFKN